MGGEKLSNSTRNRSIIGSPPHGRGKDSGTVHGCGQLRITPAWAGKSERLARCAAWAEGSPPRGRGKGGILAGRVRPKRITPAWAGKSPAGKNADKKLLGSPPRGRGKGVRSGVHRCCRWITPAQAGKSHPCRCGSAGVRDHPRTGGEKMLLLPLVDTRTGSPLRRRGKDGEFVRLVEPHRITPA